MWHKSQEELADAQGMYNEPVSGATNETYLDQSIENMLGPTQNSTTMHGSSVASSKNRQ